MIRIAVYEDYMEIYVSYLKDEVIQDIENLLIKCEIKYTKNDRYITVSEPIYMILVGLAEIHDILLL